MAGLLRHQNGGTRVKKAVVLGEMIHEARKKVHAL